MFFAIVVYFMLMCARLILHNGVVLYACVHSVEVYNGSYTVPENIAFSVFVITYLSSQFFLFEFLPSIPHELYVFLQSRKGFLSLVGISEDMLQCPELICFNQFAEGEVNNFGGCVPYHP